MTEFKGVEGACLTVEAGLHEKDTVFIGASGSDFYDNDLAPAIAAAVLEAAGVELSEYQAGALADFDPSVRPDAYDADSFLRSALLNLLLAQELAEYHAKPRVTDEQVKSVQASIADPTASYIRSRGEEYPRADMIREYYPHPTVQAVLQAALDSGVFQVPADPTNEEDDR